MKAVRIHDPIVDVKVTVLTLSRPERPRSIVLSIVEDGGTYALFSVVRGYLGSLDPSDSASERYRGDRYEKDDCRVEDSDLAEPSLYHCSVH